ncbi:FACT complex subunit ssrp1-B-like [Schistocerca gregaria]|uniref:FACT complex subunit ssrp1-B-like n=1 Tax=Schistocerca gregaria TaxID=7010 RepID=UPI00211E7CC4|nr:FACT complex subunit ssrp1-B-like [Schistocerca gregaria]
MSSRYSKKFEQSSNTPKHNGSTTKDSQSIRKEKDKAKTSKPLYSTNIDESFYFTNNKTSDSHSNKNVKNKRHRKLTSMDKQADKYESHTKHFVNNETLSPGVDILHSDDEISSSSNKYEDDEYDIKSDLPNKNSAHSNQKRSQTHHASSDSELTDKDMKFWEEPNESREEKETSEEEENNDAEANSENNQNMLDTVVVKRRRKRKERKWKKAVDAPKKASSAYICFSKSVRPLIQEELCKKKLNPTPTVLISEIACRWKALSVTQKKPYYDEANKDRLRYANEKQQWLLSQTNEVGKDKKLAQEFTQTTENSQDNKHKIFKVRAENEELFDKINLRQLTYKRLIKKIQAKKHDKRDILCITQLPNIRIRDNEDVASLPNFAELEVTFIGNMQSKKKIKTN